MMKATNPTRRTKIVQLMNNWQNTGDQKGKMRDARLKTLSEEPIEPDEEDRVCHMCPAGCREVEKSMHYLHCPVEKLIRARKELAIKVIRQLKVIGSYEGITTMIGKILKQINLRDETPFEIDELSSDGELSLKRTIVGQEKIGWKELCQGYCHKGWSIVQNRYYRWMGIDTKTMNITRWKKRFVTILGEYSLECWRLRNEILHGKDQEESSKIQLKKMRKKARLLYGKKEEIRGTKNYRIFEMPLYKRLRFGIQSITLWVGMAEEVLKLHRENATRRTIHTWLQP